MGNLPPPPSTPPGWYDDPERTGTLRYWDGTQWTDDRAPGQQQTPVVIPALQPLVEAKPSWWKRRSTNVQAVIIVAVVLIGWAILNSSGTDDEPSSPSIEDKYLARIESIAPSYFVSDSAALLYVRNFCRVDPDDRDPSDLDQIDRVVAQYCDTALARP